MDQPDTAETAACEATAAEETLPEDAAAEETSADDTDDTAAEEAAEDTAAGAPSKRLRARFNMNHDGSHASVRVAYRDPGGTDPKPAEALFGSTEGRRRLILKLPSNSCELRLDWDNGELVAIQAEGVFPGQSAAPSTKRRRVFTVQQDHKGTSLGVEPNLFAATAEFTEAGAPKLLELDASGAAARGHLQDKTGVTLDWKEGALTGVRVQGRIDPPTQPDRVQSRRIFKLRQRKNDVSLAVETSERTTPMSLAVEAMERMRDDLLATLREDMINTASGVVQASWAARPRPERVDVALPMVLIAQVQRSGGTLLSQLLDGHPEVWAFPHELKWGGDPKFRWPSVDPAREGPVRIARRLVEANAADARNFSLFGYQKQATSDREHRLPFHWSQWAYVEAFLEGWMEKPPQTRRHCLDIFMSAYFSAFLDWRHPNGRPKIVTAFTPRVNFIDTYPDNAQFFADYPDGVMISMCRPPADWYASASRHETMYEEPDEAMALWRDSVNGSLRLKKWYPNQVVLIAMPALIADPPRVMRWLAQRLGLNWHPTLLVPTFNGMPIASNSSFDPVVGIDSSVVGREHLLPPEVRAQINNSDHQTLYRRFVKNADIA